MFKSRFSKKHLEIPIKKRIFAATNPTTPLNDAYHGGTSLFKTDSIIFTSQAVHSSKPSTFISLIKNSANLYSKLSKILRFLSELR